MKKIFVAGFTLGMLAGCVSSPAEVKATSAAACTTTTATIVIPLTTTRHPHIIAHARNAVRKGYPRVYVLNRDGADARRRAALKGIPTKPGMDRDEAPPAAGRRVNKTDVAYVNSSENRSAGAIMGNTLRKYCNGTKFRYSNV